MKKIIYGFLGLMAMGFVACDDNDLPNPTPPVNSQDYVLDDIYVENQLLLEQYNLADLNAQDEQIFVALIQPELPTGYSYDLNLEISADHFETVASVPVKAEYHGPLEHDPIPWYFYINPDDLQGAIYSGISKTGQPLNLEVRYQVLTVNGNQTAYVGNPENDENYYGPFSMYVIPYEMTVVIEENYYLIGSMTDPSWDLGAAIKFNHEGEDQYSNPVFSLEVEITEAQASSLSDDGWWWKIIPQSTYESQNWDGTVIGVKTDGDTAIDGSLIDSDSQAGRMAEAGTYILTINMEEMIYNFAPVVKSLYVPGNTNNWSFTTLLPLADADTDTYTGYVGVTGGFKFTIEPDWDGPNYGAGEAEGELSDTGDNLEMGENGLYYFDVNLPSLTYTATAISTIGVIGDGTPGGWDEDTALNPNSDFTVWSGVVNFTEGSFKFRMNNAWDLNLGGYQLNLTQNGSDLTSPGTGRYEVILNLGSYPYSCRLVAQ